VRKLREQIRYIVCSLLRRQRTDDNLLPFLVYTKMDDNEEEKYKEKEEGRKKRRGRHKACVTRRAVSIRGGNKKFTALMVPGNACSSFW